MDACEIIMGTLAAASVASAALAWHQLAKLRQTELTVAESDTLDWSEDVEALNAAVRASLADVDLGDVQIAETTREGGLMYPFPKFDEDAMP